MTNTTDADTARKEAAETLVNETLADETLADEQLANEKRAAQKKALDLLARREHSVHELTEKLRQRGYADELITPIIADLQLRGYLDDSRFAEGLVAHKLRKGQGEYLIQAELRRRGISTELAQQALSQQSADWTELAIETLKRKLPAGFVLPDDRDQAYKIRAKYARFLQNRGFNSTQIQTALAELPREQST